MTRKDDSLDTSKLTLALLAGFKPKNKLIGKCIQCGKNGIKNCYSSAGKREFAISGLCEYCFDGITSKD